MIGCCYPLISLFIITSLLCLSHAATFLPLISIANNNRLGFFDLWHYGKNMSCGNTAAGYYRSDLIDRFSSDISCIDNIFLTFDSPVTSGINMKFVANYSTIEEILRGDSVHQNPESSFTPPVHRSTLHTSDGFEYKFSDDTGTLLYAGFLHPSVGSDARIIVNFTGYDLNNGLPVTTEITRVSAYASYIDTCTAPSTESPVDFTVCDSAPVVAPEFSVYDVIYGDNVTLKCTISESQFTITGALWRTVSNGNVSLDSTNLPGDIVLTLTDVNFAHKGNYSCVVTSELSLKAFGRISVNVIGDTPQITTSQSSLMGNVTDTVVLHCSVVAVPDVLNFYWLKNVNGVNSKITSADARFSVAAMPSPSLTITNIQLEDAGEYFCVASNLVGESNSTGIILYVDVADTTTNSPTTTVTIADTTSTSTTTTDTTSSVTTAETTSTSTSTTVKTSSTTTTGTTGPLCPCSCEYRAKIDYWATHNVTNMTYEEIVEWLQPKIKELEKTLTVDKTNISAILNKRISAKDNRPSARNIGVVGIVLLVTVACMIILADVLSLSQHVATVKIICGKKK